MNALSGPTDAELVARVLEADREAFAAVYDRYGDKLYDFAYAMLRHREDAADAVADSFVTFAEKLPQLRDPDRLRPWLYAIVRSECLRKLKARKRVSYGDDEQLAAMPDDATTPEEAAQRAALQKLVWDAAAGLADRDRALLDLHLRQGLEGAELGEAMGVSAANAYVMLNRLRAQVDRSLGALLIARLGREDCEELDQLLADWDGTFSPLIRKRVARHVENCDLCSERRKVIVSPWMLLASIPVFTAPLALRERVLEDTRLVAYLTPGQRPPARRGGAGRGARRIAIAAAVLLLFGGVGTGIVLTEDDEPTPPSATPTPTVNANPGTTLSSDPTPSAAPTSATPTETGSPTPTATTPGALTVTRTSIDFGASGSRDGLGIGNAGGEAIEVSAVPSVGWLDVSPASGMLAGGEDRDLTLMVSRDGLAEGAHTGKLRLDWDGGSTTVTVRLTVEHRPVVRGLTLPSAPSCEVPVTVRVSDESRLSSVVLRWSGPSGSGQAQMTLSGSVWKATAGPIPVAGDWTFRVTATDSRGNTGTDAVTTPVNPCPQ